jgi:hypothetical protein
MIRLSFFDRFDWAAAQAVDHIGQEQLGLRQAADSGQLSIDPTAATNAAKVCREHKLQIDNRVSDLLEQANHSGYGDCVEGAALHAKMIGKWQEAVALLQKEQEILDKMAQTFEAAGKHYQETEQAQADAAKRLSS